MSILVHKDTRVIVQGITGRQGSFHAGQMLAFGTKIVAGVTPGKKGQNVCNIPVYDSVKEALSHHNADFSAIFVPAEHARDAAMEALGNGLHIAIITEGVPVHDSMAIMKMAREQELLVIGPNCPGITSAGECKIGIMPNHIFRPGSVGVISRSGTLTYEIVSLIAKANLGVSTVVGIGGDQVIGMDFVDALKLFEQDEGTRQVVLIGEIGGDLEERAAEFITAGFSKPVVAYIAGRTAPPGKRMGHAGAIISGRAGTAESKISALKDAGVKIAELPSKVIELLG